MSFGVNGQNGAATARRQIFGLFKIWRRAVAAPYNELKIWNEKFIAKGRIWNPPLRKEFGKGFKPHFYFWNAAIWRATRVGVAAIRHVLQIRGWWHFILYLDFVSKNDQFKEKMRIRLNTWWVFLTQKWAIFDAKASAKWSVISPYYNTCNNSTSKIRVEFAGMMPPTTLAP